VRTIAADHPPSIKISVVYTGPQSNPNSVVKLNERQDFAETFNGAVMLAEVS
jgi:hypothetical protein